MVKMDLSDIVFENRNKEYGAYKLQKKYARTLVVAFSITLFIVLLFTGYSLAYKFYSFNPVPLPRGVIYEPTYISEEEIAAPELPEEKPQEKIEPSSEKLNETPIVTDSIPNTAQKKEEPPEEQVNEEVEEQEAIAGGGQQGVVNGEITVPIQRMPQFPGGEQALASFVQRNFKYGAKRARGVVVISFVVKRDGRVSDVKIVRSLTPEIDQECLRVVSLMPLWKPAISGGRPIEIIHNLPFSF